MVETIQAELKPEVRLEPQGIPAPYQSMLAICSDLDETPDAETYFELMRFLNTTEETSMGTGVGLEIGNTIYFDMAPGQFSYWNASEENREKIRALIKSGHIDCLHSFGDLATTRTHAARALDELIRHECQISVWIDHAQAISNFGADIMQGRGDVPGDAAYHADLTLQYGVRYVWRGRVTSVIGQNLPFSLRCIADWTHPYASANTLFKETAKQILARLGNQKYKLHSQNRLSKPITLRDGQRTTEFIRCNPTWQGVSNHATGYGIAEVLTNRFLDRLVERNGLAIIYTHLGKLGQGNRRFSHKTINGFRLLREYFLSKKILVVTTKRLLDHISGTSLPNDANRLTFPPV